MITSPWLQTEKFKVEKYKQLRDQPGRPWAWVTVGYFTAGTLAEARAMARDAIADKLCILRAVRVGALSS